MSLGYHVNTWTGSARGSVRAARSGVLKVLNTAIDHDEILLYKKANPDGLVIYRHVFPDGSSRDAGYRCDLLIKSIAPIRDIVDIVETPWNEEMQDASSLQSYASMTNQAVGILEDQGFTCAIGHFSTSQPQLADWHLFFPALVPSKRPKYLSVHEYGAPRMQDGGGCLRYRSLVAMSPATSSMPVIVTECGIDGGVIGASKKGWHTYIDAKGYADQLTWYGNEIAKDGVRATIYACGTYSDWQDFDVAGQGAIESVITASATLPQTPPIGGNTVATYTVGQGVKDLMAKHGDSPKSDEHYVVDATGQTFKSETFGSKGLYQWNKQANETVLIPFG